MGSMTTVPPSVCQVAPAIHMIRTPGYLNEIHQLPSCGPPRSVMEISATKPSGTPRIVWYVIRTCIRGCAGRRGGAEVSRSGDGDGCPCPRAVPAAIGPPDAVPRALWLASGFTHPSAVQVVPGPELLNRRYVWVVPKASTATVTTVTLKTNVGVTISRRSELPLGAR